MFKSRTAKGAAVARQLMTIVAAVMAAFAFTATGSTSASADDVPFWEQADRNAAKKKSASGKTSKKSYASKKSKKSYAKKKSSTSYASSEHKPKLGGHAEATEPVKHKKKGVKVAALHDDDSYYQSKPKKSLSGGGVNWVASSGCLDSGLKSIIYNVASNYGPVTVSSTCRSKGHNASVGGAPKSKHLSGDAVDFRVHGNIGGVYAYLKGNGGVGGLKHYGGGLFHIDNGDRRSW
jgi:uncharacterized protein YcbK (DUF882 family)